MARFLILPHKLQDLKKIDLFDCGAQVLELIAFRYCLLSLVHVFG